MPTTGYTGYIGTAASSGSDAVSCTDSSGFDHKDIVAFSVSNLSGIVDQQNSNYGTTSPSTSGAVTITHANELLISTISLAPSQATANSPWVTPSGAGSATWTVFEYQIVTSTSSYNSSFAVTGGGLWYNAIATLY